MVVARYIVLGHARERLEPRNKQQRVPDGSVLVLTEECGMLGTVPNFFYDILSEPETAYLFTDPVMYQADIERLLKRRIRIYGPGQRMPTIFLDLISDVDGRRGTYNPSGLFALPLNPADVVLNPSARGDRRYETTSYARSAQGAVFPPPGGKRKGVSQQFLLSEFKGVHYNFLCRSVERNLSDGSRYSFESEFRTFLGNNIGVDPEAVLATNVYDAPAVAADYLATLNMTGLETETREAALALRRRAEEILQRRRSSGSPLRTIPIETAARLLANPHTDASVIRESLASIPDSMIDAPETRMGRTLLMLAARGGHQTAAEELLRRGASVHTRSYDGHSPLHEAASAGHLALARILVDAGADVNLESVDGSTPLHHAAVVATPEGHAIIRLLLARGANPNVRDDEGYTPLAIAVGYPQAAIIGDLIEAGADPTIPIETGRAPFYLAMKDKQRQVAEALLTTDAELGITAADFGIAVERKYDAIALEIINRLGYIPSRAKLLEHLRKKGGMPRLLKWVEARVRSSTERRRRRSSGTRKRSHS